MKLTVTLGLELKNGFASTQSVSAYAVKFINSAGVETVGTCLPTETVITMTDTELPADTYTAFAYAVDEAGNMLGALVATTPPSFVISQPTAVTVSLHLPVSAAVVIE